MIKRYLLLILILLLRWHQVSGQYYDTGTDPASLKWLQIKTDRYTLIYPESYSSMALEYARSLDRSVSRLSPLFRSEKIRIPVVIHNLTTFSNGYVAWAPKRMEIYPTPEQNTIPLDPVEQLTLHEMTHVMQMRSLNKGFTKIAGFALGEQLTGIVSALAPMWYLEGDAVLAESYLTPSGRGRAPSFQKQMKAVTLEGSKLYGYDKMVIGSFRRHIPDHYQFGYQMVAWASLKNGHHIWNNTLDYIAKYPFSVVPVNISLKQGAGLVKSSLYKQTFDSLRRVWRVNVESSGAVTYEPANKPKKNEFINYFSPVFIGRDSVVAIKTSMFNPALFVLINLKDKTEKRIHTPGNLYPWFISGGNGSIVWVEQIPDPRWENRDYSVIKILNIKNGKVLQLTRRSRYLSAALSPDSRYVAATENTIENKNKLVIIDVANGKVMKSAALPGNVYPQKPAWSASGDQITIISLSHEGEGVIEWSVRDESWNTIIKPSATDLQSAFLRNDSLFYVSSSSGTENVWLLTPEGEQKMLTNSRYGAIDPSVSGKKIVFADYSISGNNLAFSDLQNVISQSQTKYQHSSFIVNRLDTIAGTGPQNEENYIPVPYRKWKHLFRFHSWMPFYADIEEIQSDPASVSPGFSLMSQNDLSTLITTVGYEYANGRHLFHSRVKWQGWFPVFESRIDYGYQPIIYKPGSQTGDPQEINPGMLFTNTISVPLSFSTRRFSQYLNGSISSNYNNRYIFRQETGNYDYGQTMVTSRIYLSNIHKSAIRDIYPRWGQVADYYFSSFPADKEIYGTLSSLRTSFYFPGIFRNHSFKLRYQFEHQNLPPSNRILGNRSDLPRGYTDIISVDYRLYSSDYALPLLYPDFTIPGLLLVKRIRGGIFYDYAVGNGNYYIGAASNPYHDYREVFSSFGTELLADFHMFRIPFMISAGVQASWKDTGQSPVIRGLFKIDVYGLKVGRQRY